MACLAIAQPEQRTCPSRVGRKSHRRWRASQGRARRERRRPIPGGLQGGGGGRGGGGGTCARRQLKSGTAGGCGRSTGLTVIATHRHASTAVEPTLHAIARRTESGCDLTCSNLQRTSSGIPSTRRVTMSSGRVGPPRSACRCSHRSDSISARRASRTEGTTRHVYSRVQARTAPVARRSHRVMPAPRVCALAAPPSDVHQRASPARPRAHRQ